MDHSFEMNDSVASCESGMYLANDITLIDDEQHHDDQLVNNKDNSDITERISLLEERLWNHIDGTEMLTEASLESLNLLLKRLYEMNPIQIPHDMMMTPDNNHNNHNNGNINGNINDNNNGNINGNNNGNNGMNSTPRNVSFISTLDDDDEYDELSDSSSEVSNNESKKKSILVIDGNSNAIHKFNNLASCSRDLEITKHFLHGYFNSSSKHYNKPILGLEFSKCDDDAQIVSKHRKSLKQIKQMMMKSKNNDGISNDSNDSNDGYSNASPVTYKRKEKRKGGTKFAHIKSKTYEPSDLWKPTTNKYAGSKSLRLNGISQSATKITSNAKRAKMS